MMQNQISRNNFLRSYEYLVLLFAFIAMQMTSGQFICLGLLMFFIINRILRVIYVGKIITRIDRILLCFHWLLIVFSLIKFNQKFNMEVYIQLFWLLSGFLILSSIVFLRIGSSKEILDILVVATTTMGIIALLGYYFGFDINHIISPPYAGTRIVGGFDGPNEIATFNLFPFTYSLNMIFYTKKKKKKYFINVIITMLIIVVSWSRGGLIGSASSLIMSLVVYFRKRITITKKIKLLIIVMVVILITNDFILPNLFEVRKNASTRVDMVGQMLQPIIQKPITGWGLGSFSENSMLRNTTPHNGYIFILYSGGIISFILYAIFFIIILKKILLKRDYIMLLLYFTFLIQEMVFNNLIRGRVSFIFWALIVLLYCGDRIIDYSEHSVSNSEINIQESDD